MKKIFSLVAVSLLAGSAFADNLAEGTYYIKQASANAFMTRGQGWGTQGVVEPFGHPWKVSAIAEGKYKLQMLDLYTQGTTGKGLGDNGYTDGANHDVTIVSSENGYVLTVNGKNISVNASNQLAVDTENQTEFQFLSVDQYKAALAAATAAQEAAVATAAGITLGESSLAAYLAENFATKAITTGFSAVPVAGDAAWTFTVGRNGSTLNYGTYGIECFQGAGNLTQTISGLKPGLYKVGIKAMQRSTSNAACYKIGQDGFVNSGCYLSANNNVVGINDWYSSCVSDGNPNSPADFVAIANNGGYYSSVYAVVGEDGTLDIKVAFPSFWNPGSWFLFNGIDLTYYMDKSNGLTVYISDFEALKATAEGLLASPMDSAVKAALEAAMATPAETIEAYQAAITALTTAINDAKVSVMKYNNTVGADVTELAAAEWNAAQGEDKEKKAYATGWQTYGETAFQPGKVLYQSIEGLIPGAEYEVSFYAVANMAWKDFATGAGIAEVFANDSVKGIDVIAQTGCTPASDEYLHILKATVGKNGVLQFGIQNVGVGGNWYVAQTKSIVSVGNTTVASYANVTNAIDAIRKAIAEAAKKFDSKFTEVDQAYKDSLAILSAQVDSVEAIADSLFAAVAIAGQSDSLIALLPTNAQVEIIVAAYEAAIAELKVSDVEYVNLKTWNFRDASQFAVDTRVAVASLTIEYDTVPDGTKLYQSTDPMWDGLVFQPAGNDGTNSWWVRARNSGTDYGLARVNGTAWFAITDLHAGFKVTIEAKAAMTMADSSMVSDIVKNESTLCGQGVSYTYTMAKDGMLAFQQNGVYMYRIIIDAPIVARYTAHDWNFRDASQFPVDTRVTVASLSIEYDTVPDGTKLYQSTDPMWDGLAFQPAGNDGTNSWWVRARNGGTDYGLARVNGTAWFAITDLKAGAKVTIEAKAAMVLADSTMVSSFVQNEKTTCGQGVSWTYTMAKSGFLAFQQNGVYMYRIIVEQPVNYMVETVRNFRDASQYPVDTRVTVASLTIEYDTVPDGTKLYQSTDPMWDGLVFQPAGNDGTNSWWVRARNSGTDYGLARVNGTAWFGIIDLRAGETVTIEAKAAMVMADSSMVSEIVKNESTLCGQGVSYTYTMAKDGMLAFQQNGVYMYRIITNQYGGLDAGTPMPTITAEGETYMANLITIECEAEGAAITYTIDDGEEQTYTEPFYLSSSAVIAAKADLNGVVSKTAYLAVTAGEVVAPTVSTIAAKNEERTVVFASATAPAYLKVNGDSVANSDTVKITATTNYEVVAVYIDEHVGNILSDTVKATVEAGYPVQLNQVSVVKVSDSDTAWVFTVDNSSADIIGKPETQISYEVYPSGEKADVAHGDTLTFATHQRITLVANAEGYATSEPMIVWTREPAKLELVWSDDYQTIAEEKTGAGNSYGVVLQDPTFSVGGYNLCPVQVADDYVSNENFGVQSGTSWLQRNVNGYIGLYNYNSGPRRFGINNLRKTQVVKLTVQDPAQVFLDNDVLQLDETNSTANTLYYNCVKDGAALLNMSRYYCIWKVEVFNNPDVTASPNIYIAGKEGDTRSVAIVPASVAYPVNQFTYYAISNGTRVDSTLVTAATDSTEAVYQVDTVTIFNDFAPIAGEFTVSKPNNTVIAYTEYEGKVSEQNIVEIDCDSIYSLLLPTIAWKEKTAEGHIFIINNPNPIKSGLYPQLKVAYNGQSDIEYCNESLDCPVAGSGWLTVQAILPGMDTAYVVSRYVAEARESYNENYDAITDGDTLTAGAYVGDIEIAAGAAVSGTYPTKAIAVTGTQFFHVAATEYFSAVTLPFAFTPGKNIVTDAKGNELVAGEDYEIATLHNLANGNVPTGKDAANVANFTNMAGCVRTSDLTAGTAILFRALSEKVGAEVILVSDAKKPVAVAVTATTMPTSGWKIYGNKRMQNVALENSVYVLNAAGDKLVLTENPTIAPMGVALMAEAATVQALGNEILLVGDPSAIDVVEDAISQFEVNTVYDLQGRQVETLKKGQVYLINGRRYMVK